MTDMPHNDDRQVAGFSRRGLIGAGVAALSLAATAAQAQSYDDAEKGAASFSAPGPANKPLDAMNADSVRPPPTDHGSVPEFWHSFSLSHRRIQEGGWARQVNEVDFPISKAIAAVNMRLDAGGVRELHWHDAAEWSLMLTGSARLTAIDYDGRPYVKDVKAGDLWYFPSGVPSGPRPWIECVSAVGERFEQELLVVLRQGHDRFQLFDEHACSHRPPVTTCPPLPRSMAALAAGSIRCR